LRLTASVHGAFTPAGVRIDGVAADSLFARIGLRAGDVVDAVDGRPLRSIDDTATLYARAASARNVVIHVQRASKPLTLRVAITQ
jgi:S1-C subfamily serine protease